MIIKGGQEFNEGKAGADGVKIKAIDESTFQMELTAPAPYALGMLAHYSFAITPTHVIAKFGDKWTNVENFVGNGPFKLSEWKPQEKLVVVKNDKYWDKKAVKLDSVVYIPTEDNNTAMNMFINGEIDWCTEVPSDRIEEAKALPAYHNAPILGTYYYVFNTVRKPFDDARVRKALSMAISRKDVVEKITKTGDIPAFGMVPPMGDYKALEGKEDVEEAKKLLAEAGYPGGKGFKKFTILYNTNDNHKKIAEYVQQAWETNLGIKVELENQEWATYISNKDGGNFDVARAGWIGDYLDPNTFLELFISTSGQNGGKYNNPKFDEAIESQKSILDPKKRLAMLKTAEEYLITQDQALMPFYYYSQESLVDMDKWGGWYPNTLDIHPFKYVYRK
jgi:oligopeptide transport system substrate-binding protein